MTCGTYNGRIWERGTLLSSASGNASCGSRESQHLLPPQTSFFEERLFLHCRTVNKPKPKKWQKKLSSCSITCRLFWEIPIHNQMPLLASHHHPRVGWEWTGTEKCCQMAGETREGAGATGTLWRPGHDTKISGKTRCKYLGKIGIHNYR